MARPDRRRRPPARPERAGRSSYKGSPRPRADPARAAALEVLRGVADRDAYANLLLATVLGRAGLDGRDAAFATELSAGTLRMRGLYDAVLATVVGRPLDRLDPAVLDVLRLGSHQILSMRVPAHAAVSTSVDLVRATVGPRPAGLVNAVLRKVGATDVDGWVERVVPAGADRIDRLAIRHSHPRWVVEELAAALHGTDDELASLLAADNTVGPVTLVARPGRAEPGELLGEGGTAGALSPWAVRLAGGDPGAIAAVREGRAGVQDEGSQVVAKLLADAPVAGTDERWLDLCAGPGGKAALLAALAAQRGASLVANEVQPHRAELVRRAVGPAANVTVTVADGRMPAWEPGTFDRVLVDAPCTGLGALRRRPEARWRRTRDDLPDLVTLQQQLLDSAATLTRPGGAVVYATCSPVTAETEQVVAAVLRARPDLRLLAPGPDLPVDAYRAGGDFVQLWPHRHDTDAMFAAVLRREPTP